MSALDINQSIAVRRAIQLLEIFRSIDADMPIGEAMSLLLIAQGETRDGGLTVTELNQKGDFALSSASRYMQSLNMKNRHGRAGHELVTDPRDPNDERRKVLQLTPKGRRIIGIVTTILGG